MENKNVLLVSDFVGVGKVALSTMIPVLSTMEARLNYLPTAVVSNNFDYGDVVLKDLTGFMEDSKNVWKRLDFRFDIIATGILMNVEQVNIVKEIIAWHEEKPLIVVDPIMGDEGQIYPGLADGVVEASRESALIGDLIIPNLTELSLILARDYPEDISHELMVDWLEILIDQGVKSAVITSVNIGDDHFVYAFDNDKEIFRVEFKHVPLEVGGTGDLFTSLLIGILDKSDDLKEAIEYTTRILSDIIQKEYDEGHRGRISEVSIEKYLQDIYKAYMDK